MANVNKPLFSTNVPVSSSKLSSSLTPSQAGVYSLGSSSLEWKEVYVQNLYMSGVFSGSVISSSYSSTSSFSSNAETKLPLTGGTLTGNLTISGSQLFVTGGYIEVDGFLGNTKDTLVAAAPVAGEFSHRLTSGSATIGHGVSIDLTMNTDTTERQIGTRLSTSWLTASNAGRTSKFSIFLLNSGSFLEHVNINPRLATFIMPVSASVFSGSLFGTGSNSLSSSWSDKTQANETASWPNIQQRMYITASIPLSSSAGYFTEIGRFGVRQGPHAYLIGTSVAFSDFSVAKTYLITGRFPLQNNFRSASWRRVSAMSSTGPYPSPTFGTQDYALEAVEGGDNITFRVVHITGSLSYSVAVDILNLGQQQVTFSLSTVTGSGNFVSESWSSAFVEQSEWKLSISGAVEVSQSVKAAGGFTGSLFGTSSWAESASFLSSQTNAFIQGGNSFGTTAMLGTNDANHLIIEVSGSPIITISGSGANPGLVGINVQPISLLHIQMTNSGSSPIEALRVVNTGFQGTATGCRAVRIIAQCTASTAEVLGLSLTSQVSGTGSFANGVTGIQVVVGNLQSASITSSIGINVSNTTTTANSAMTNSFGYFLDVNQNAGTIWNSYGFFLSRSLAQGTSSGLWIDRISATGGTYGVYIGTQNAAAAVNWGIFQSESFSKNYFGGKVGIGTVLNPTFQLQVSGTIGPSGSNNFDLGSDSVRFRDIFFTGSIQGQSYTWSGSYVNFQTPNTYSLRAGDNGKLISFTSSSLSQLVLSSSLPYGFRVDVYQSGSGQIVIDTGSTDTVLRNRQSQKKTAGQYAVVTIWRVQSGDFVLYGDTGA